MTNTAVSQLCKGDVVRDDRGVRFTVTGPARMSRTNTHYEAWAVSASGSLVVRVTHNGTFTKEKN